MRHILVVEDDLDTAEAVTRVLERAGHEVVTVASGAEALAFLHRMHEPCLVLLDLSMIDMDGWEVLSALRAAQRSDHYVVIMSGLAPEKFPRGLPALHKPFTGRQLLCIVDGALQEIQDRRAS